ncbi:MAG: hypothetical protein IKP82_02470 [Oscillospiraceae bacterium]|nr:hypothetical protein [Oscillospiraceae bacterium]
MLLDGQTRLARLLEAYPWLLDEAKQIDRRFSLLETVPGKLLLKRATVSDLSRRAGLSEAEVLEKLRLMIAAHGG